MTHIVKWGGTPLIAAIVLLFGLSGMAQAGLRYPTNRTIWDVVNALRYLADWPVIRDATAYAETEANRRYPNDPLNPNGPRNAFKHALWAAILTAELGDTKARNITNGHEAWAGNPPLEKQMDLFNNDVGHKRGLINPKANWFLLGNLIQNNVAAGNMRIIRNGQLVPSNR